jgi:hypothetical protein
VGGAEEEAHRPDDEDSDGITLGQIAASVAVILRLQDPAVVYERFSPALCELIYRTTQREMLREKLVDLQIVTVPHKKEPDVAYHGLQRNLTAIIKGEDPDG